LPLSSKIEIREIHGKKVFVVEDGYLMACFDNDINDAVITAIAKEKPYYFVMCDRSIASDSVADNFDQIFNAYSKETVRRIL
jgi:adenine-specific DNA-methyltransferase